MENPIDISIVTISYNSKKFIEECLNSVINQLSEKVEYIVIDGNSRDGTVQILNANRNVFSTLVIEKDNGPADALNKGFQRAKGEFIFYLNSDDYLLPGAIDKMLRVVKNTTADVLYGSALMLNEGFSKKIVSDRWNLLNYVSGKCMIVQHSTLIRNQAYITLNGGFNTKNSDNWDGELLVDLALNGAKFRHHKSIFAVFRIHDGSITGKQSNLTSLNATRARIKNKISEVERKSLKKILIANMYIILNLFITKPQRLKANGFSLH